MTRRSGHSNRPTSQTRARAVVSQTSVPVWHAHGQQHARGPPEHREGGARTGVFYSFLLPGPPSPRQEEETERARRVAAARRRKRSSPLRSVGTQHLGDSHTGVLPVEWRERRRGGPEGGEGGKGTGRGRARRTPLRDPMWAKPSRGEEGELLAAAVAAARIVDLNYKCVVRWNGNRPEERGGSASSEEEGDSKNEQVERGERVGARVYLAEEGFCFFLASFFFLLSCRCSEALCRPSEGRRRRKPAAGSQGVRACERARPARRASLRSHGRSAAALASPQRKRGYR